MSAKRDVWDSAAAHRLRQHVMRAVLRGRDYAPDQTYELSKASQVAPVSAHIATILQRHADLWATDMRESQTAAIDVDEQRTWNACIAEADAEIDRYLMGSKTRAA